MCNGVGWGDETMCCDETCDGVGILVRCSWPGVAFSGVAGRVDIDLGWDGGVNWIVDDDRCLGEDHFQDESLRMV